jgi:hypothetical protein
MATAADAAKNKTNKPDASGQQPHACNYPGRAVPKAQAVGVEGAHNAKVAKAGKAMSMGTSADGSHKSLPSSKIEIGKMVTQPAPPKHGRNYPGRSLPSGS